MSTNKDLLKQAIAEARTIRETAIANAKEALEESITPHLREMLAMKLQEMEEELPQPPTGDEYGDEFGNLEEAEEEEAPEVEEEEPTEEEGEEGGEEEPTEEDDEDLDFDNMTKEEFTDLVLSIVAQEEDMPVNDMTGMEDQKIDLEEIDINELLRELEEGNYEEMEEGEEPKMEGMENPKVEGMREPNPVEEDLYEALKTVNELRKQLQEVNLLNAKLLYVNKVFKANNLTEGQKVNVVAAFDKAETVREVKLVFETVSKNVVAKQPVKQVVREHRSFASKPAGTTKTQVINEVSEAVNRMQILAGIKPRQY